MRHLFWICGLVCGLTWNVSGVALHAVEVGFVEDFESGRGGWDGSPPTVQDSGGPAGADDAFLVVDSRGGIGPGSRVAIFNDTPNWTGDFAAAGIGSIELDIMNMESSPVPMSMRLVLFGPTSTGNRWTSVDPIVIPNDGLWQRVSFVINASTVTRVQGNATYSNMLENVIRVMLRHDPGTPSGQGPSARGTVGIDNITLVEITMKSSDFNGDGVVDVQDVDLLLGEVKSGNNAPQFDLSGEGVVNSFDIEAMIMQPDTLNTYIGDANLDGEFNSGDLVLARVAGQYEDDVAMNSTWESGDWNGDAEFSTSDLIFALQGGGYEAGPRAAELAVAIPEPASCLLFLLGTVMLLRRR